MTFALKFFTASTYSVNSTVFADASQHGLHESGIWEITHPHIRATHKIITSHRLVETLRNLLLIGYAKIVKAQAESLLAIFTATIFWAAIWWQVCEPKTHSCVKNITFPRLLGTLKIKHFLYEPESREHLSYVDSWGLLCVPVIHATHTPVILVAASRGNKHTSTHTQTHRVTYKN